MKTRKMLLLLCGLPLLVWLAFTYLIIDPEGSHTLWFPTTFQFKGRTWVMGGDFEKKTRRKLDVRIGLFGGDAGLWSYDTVRVDNGEVFSVPDETKGLEIFVQDPEDLRLDRTLVSAGTLSTPDVIRREGSYLEHAGRIFVIGGKNQRNPGGRNVCDVWSSSDGATWVPVLAKLPWETDASEEADRRVSHGGSLFVAHPLQDRTVLWRSADGKAWHVSAELPGLTSVRGLVSFKGRLVLVGSLQGTGVAAFHSLDGSSWTHSEAKPVPMGLALLPSRDTLWSIGGNVVYASRDGIHWDYRSNGSELPNSPANYAVFRDRLAASGLLGDEVAFTQDGIHWADASGKGTVSLQPEDLGSGTEYFDSTSHQLVHFKGAAWIIGDSAERVFRSVDGLSWTKVEPRAGKGFLPRSRAAVAVFKDRLWVLGGVWCGPGHRLIEMGDVWSSPDGESWERVLEHAEWGPERDMRAVVFNGQLVLVTGGGRLAFWASEDGEHWKNTFTDGVTGDLDTEIRPGLLHMVEHRGKLHVFDLHRETRSEVLVTDDARRFRKLDLEQDTERTFNSIVRLASGNGSCFVSNGYGELFLSRDLLDWQGLALPPGDELDSSGQSSVFSLAGRVFQVRVCFGSPEPVQSTALEIDTSRMTAHIIR